MEEMDLSPTPAEDKAQVTLQWKEDAFQEFGSLISGQRKRILSLIQDITEGGRRGHPEALTKSERFNLAMSRRITKGDRLVYTYDQNTRLLTVLACSGHYE